MMRHSTGYNPWIALGGIWFIAFFLYILMQCISPLLPILILDFKLNHWMGGFLYSLPILMIALFSYPLGVISDRIGIERAIGWGVTIALLSSLFRPFSVNFYFLALSTAFFGLGFAMCFPNLPKLVKEYFPQRLAGTATGAYTTAIPLGSGLGISLTKPLLAAVGSWREVIFIWSLMPIPVTIFWWVLARMRRGRKDGGDRWASGQETTGNASRDDHGIRPKGWLFGPVLICGILLSFLNLIFYCTIGWLPTYLSERGWEPVSAATATSVISFVEIPAVFLVPVLSDWLKRRRLIIFLSFLAIAICSVALSLRPSLTWFLTPILGITFGGVFALLLALPVELIERARVGQAAGAIISIGYIGALLGPPATGYLRDLTGDFAGGFLAMAFAGLLAMGLTYALPEIQRAG